jgi:hypothetical protein
MAPLPVDFLFEPVGEVLVMLHTRKPAPDAEWDLLVDHLARTLQAGRPIPPGLVLTDGGGPTTAQRKALEQVLDVRQLRTAVVSEAASVRFVVSTLALFSENVRSFPITGVDDALAWFGLPGVDRLELRRGLVRLARTPAASPFVTLRTVVDTLKG